MDTITLSVEIPEDRHVEFDVPEGIPVGPAEVIIRSHSESYERRTNPAREAAQAKLLAAGFLVTNIRAPEGTVPLAPEERLRLGTLPPGSPSVDDLINEDRGEF